MSKKSWMAEFYPVDASVPKTPKAALLHSIQKWEGLRKVNLKKHNIYAWGKSLVSGNNRFMYIDSSTCALCVVCQCNKCPLYMARDECRCDDPNSEYDKNNAPFQCFSVSGNPEPMIAFLEKALGEL
jgi:hypothetical protein